jgi:hypothetical protein
MLQILHLRLLLLRLTLSLHKLRLKLRVMQRLLLMITSMIDTLALRQVILRSTMMVMR